MLMAGANVFKVRLRGMVDGASVIFDATPEMIETRNVNYNNIDPLHMPGQIYIYKSTSSRNYQVSNARLITRTQVEADANLKMLWTLRGWTMPRFGKNSSTLSPKEKSYRELFSNSRANKKTPKAYGGNEMLGAPPEVLLLSAYSDSSKAIAQHINRVPVVIQQLSIPYPSDVDYIPTTEGIPMPTVMTIDMTLMETHSPNEYEAFNLSAFKQGILPGY
jgi:hypothetical protein